MKRLLFIVLIGLVIVGGASTSASIEINCAHCGRDGKQECLKCGGAGAFVFPQVVECGCRGEKPDCPICRGAGMYLSFGTGVCLVCDGSGGESCPYCGGRGKIRANEKFLKVLGLK